mmetsp:Transcript_31600/g.54101  ORF Transcript_31600/g.54101 Transcript_31600/m.54101 type:complete len:215 (-) Transcript_31600:51-695(-)
MSEEENKPTMTVNEEEPVAETPASEDKPTEDKPAEEKPAEDKPAESSPSISAFAPAPSVPTSSEPSLAIEEVKVETHEEDEEILVKLRAKLYRMATECTPPEWKERGTGEIKLLKHNETGKIRVLMRREKTLKICANHYVHPAMKLEENCASDRSWLYKTPVDFSDGSTGGEELLAVRFPSVENAQQFKDVFVKAQEEMQKIMDDALAEGKTSA